MKLTVAWAFPALAVTVVGLPGAVAGVGVTLLDAAEARLVPVALVAVIVKV
jgi:hypothetical protein